MAKVKSFKMHSKFGVPDRDIKDWLDLCEKEEGIIQVTTVWVPLEGATGPRLTIIVTKLDEAN